MAISIWDEKFIIRSVSEDNYDLRIALQKRPIEIDRIEQMVTGIVRRLESLGETDIPSEKVGEIVMETLARIDTVAYVRFASVYKNFQAADDFEDFVSQLRPDTK